METTPARSASGVPLQGFLIRAGIVYAALVALMHPEVLGPLGLPLRVPLHLLAKPFAEIVGLARYPLQGELLFRILLSLVCSAVWGVVAKSVGDDRIRLRVMLAEWRFVFAAGLLSYGLGHLLAVTSPFPSQADWMRPIREMTAPEFMTVWYGSSPLQKTSLGLSAIAAGIALLWPRTATFGALLGVGVIGNEAFTQLAFGDMRIGRYWLMFELAGIGTVLLLADIRRLLDAFIYEERTVAELPPAPAWPIGWMDRLARNGAVVAAALLMAANLPTLLRGFDGLFSSHIAGVYYVDEFTVDGRPIAPENGASRWRWVAMDDCDRFAVRTVGDRQLEGKVVVPGAGSFSRKRVCSTATEASAGTITFVPPDSMHSYVAQPGLGGSLRYSRASDGALDLDGTVQGVAVRARLRRMADSSFRVFKYLTDARL